MFEIFKNGTSLSQKYLLTFNNYKPHEERRERKCFVINFMFQEHCIGSFFEIFFIYVLPTPCLCVKYSKMIQTEELINIYSM